MPPDERVRQLARLLGLRRGAGGEEVSAAARERPEVLAAALAAEAAENDDVTSAEAARDYLELRLRFFGELVGPPVDAAVRRRFDELVSRWERLTPPGSRSRADVHGGVKRRGEG